MGRLGEPFLPGLASGAISLALILLCALFSPDKSAGQSRPRGPLTWEEGSPVARLAYTPAFERAEVVSRRELTSDLWLGYSNIFEQDSSATHVVFLDTERLLSAVTVRWGVAEGLEAGARVTLETTGAGFIDSFVDWYHETLGFGHANRDRFPQDRYAQRVTDGALTEYVDLRRRSLALADVQLFAKWSAVPGADGGPA